MSDRDERLRAIRASIKDRCFAYDDAVFLLAELDAAEKHSIAMRETLESVKSALGDRLLAKGPLSESYAHGVMRQVTEALDRLRSEEKSR